MGSKTTDVVRRAQSVITSFFSSFILTQVLLYSVNKYALLLLLVAALVAWNFLITVVIDGSLIPDLARSTAFGDGPGVSEDRIKQWGSTADELLHFGYTLGLFIVMQLFVSILSETWSVNQPSIQEDVVAVIFILVFVYSLLQKLTVLGV